MSSEDLPTSPAHPLHARIDAKFRRADLSGLTGPQIARDLRVDRTLVATYLDWLVEKKLVYLKQEKGQGALRWIWHEFKPVAREAPWRNSNQPTGDQLYWEEHIKKLGPPPGRRA